MRSISDALWSLEAGRPWSRLGVARALSISVAAGGGKITQEVVRLHRIGRCRSWLSRRWRLVLVFFLPSAVFLPTGRKPLPTS